MMLILFLALIAPSAFVSGQCDLGPPRINNFKYIKFADDRPWYILMQDSNTFDDTLDCPVGTAAEPQCNISLISNVVYDTQTQNYVTLQGYVRNWKKTGYLELIHQAAFWTGTFLVLEIDYDRYLITRHCPLGSPNPPGVYVAFRSSRPDIVTWLRVLKGLLENKIDIRQLAKYSTNHCQEPVSSTEGGSSA